MISPRGAGEVAVFRVGLLGSGRFVEAVLTTCITLERATGMARDRGLPGDASTFALLQLRLLVQSLRHGPFRGYIHCGLLGKT